MKKTENVTIRGKTPNIKIDYNENTKILTLYANTTYDPCIIKEDVYIEYGTGIILDFSSIGVGRLYQVKSIIDTDLILSTYLMYKESDKTNKELTLCFRLNSAGYETFKTEGIGSCSLYKKGDIIAQILFN